MSASHTNSDNNKPKKKKVEEKSSELGESEVGLLWGMFSQ